SISSWLPGKDWSVFDDHACSFPPFLCSPSVCFFGVHLFVLLTCLRLLSPTSPVLIQAPMRSSCQGDDDADHFTHYSYYSGPNFATLVLRSFKGTHIKVRPKITWYGSISQFFFSQPLRNAALARSWTMV